MRCRHTCTLLLIAGLLAGYAWFFERPHSKRKEIAADKRIFPELTADLVTSLTIQNAVGHLQMIRTNGTWRIQSPVDYPAEETNIRALLENFTQLRYQGEPASSSEENQSDLDLYGLESPAQSIVLIGDGVSLQLQVGDSESAIVFVQRSDSKRIYTVPAQTLKPLARNVDYWRNSKVFPHPVSQINDFIFKGDERMRLKRSADGEAWQMVEPTPGARLDQDALSIFFQQLAELRVSSFDGTAAPAKQAMLEFLLDGGLRYPIELLGAHADNPMLHRARLGSTRTDVSIPATWVHRLLKANAFRSPYLLNPNLKFEKITIHAREKFTLSINAEARSWQLSTPIQVIPMPADNRLAAQFLSQLAELRICKFFAEDEWDASRFGLDSPILSLTFHRREAENDPGKMLHVQFGRKIYDTIAARRSDEPAVYAVPYEAVMRLPAYAWELRDRKLWNFDAQDVARLKWTHPNQATRIWQRSGAVWQIGDTSLGEVESAVLNECLYRLSKVMVESWTSRNPNDDDQYDVGHHARIEIEFKDGNQTSPKILNFGKITSQNHRYAESEVDGESMIFEFPGALYHQLHQILGWHAATNHENQ